MEAAVEVVELSVVLFFFLCFLCLLVMVLPVVEAVLVFWANMPVERAKPRANADTVSFFIFYLLWFRSVNTLFCTDASKQAIVTVPKDV